MKHNTKNTRGIFRDINCDDGEINKSSNSRKTGDSEGVCLRQNTIRI